MIREVWRRIRRDATVEPMRRWYEQAPQYWTAQDVSVYCGVTRRAVRLWIERGKLAPDAWYRHGEGHAPLFDPERVRAWWRSLRTR